MTRRICRHVMNFLTFTFAACLFLHIMGLRFLPEDVLAYMVGFVLATTTEFLLSLEVTVVEKK